MQINGDVVQRNKALVRAITDEAFNKGDLSRVDRSFAPDYVTHAPGVPPLPPGPEAFRQAVALWRDAFPDIHVTIEDVIGEGDKVYCRFTTRGTHRGSLMGIPATGNTVTIHETTCHRVVNDVVQESWIGDNVPNILHQIGVLVHVETAGIENG